MRATLVLAAALLVSVCGCGPSTASRISMAIEIYCTAQAVVPERTAAPRAPGAACADPADCDTSACASLPSYSFCTLECASPADCTPDVPRCGSLGLGGPLLCLPATSANRSRRA